MTTRELWKESPEFRQSMRKLVMYASIGWLVGIGWVQIGKRLPVSWREIWAFAFLFAVIAAGLYMLWDIRRLKKESLELQRTIELCRRTGRKATNDVLQLLAESLNTSDETRAKARELLKEGRPWLN